MAETSLRRSSVLMTIGSMASRVLGMVRTALLTGLLGLGFANDAFTTANSLPNAIFALIAGGVLNAVLVPQLVQATKRADGGQDFTDRLLTVALLGMAVVTLLATVFAPFLIRVMTGSAGNGSRLYDLALAFGYICMPQIFFYGLYALLGNVLNARGQFVAYAWAPFWANVISIVGWLGFMLAMPDPRPGADGTQPGWTAAMILWFGGTATASIAVQGLSLIIPLRRSGFRYTPRWGLRGSGLGQVGRVGAWAFGAVAVSQLPYVVSTAVLNGAVRRGAGEGFVPGIGAASNAYQIFMLPHGFVTVSILTALYPRISAAAADRRYDALKRDYRRGMALPLVANIPAMVLIIVLCRPLVSFFNPGVARGDELGATALILAVMILAIIPWGLDLLNYRFLYALDDARNVFWNQVIWVAVSVAVTCVALVAAPRYAAYIYAASIVISNYVSWYAGVVVLRRRIGNLGIGQVVPTAVRAGLACLVAGAAAYGLDRLWQPVTRALLDALSGLSHWFARPIAYGVEIVVVGAVFGAIFLVLGRRLHIAEVSEMVDAVAGRLIRRRRAADPTDAR